MKNTVRKVPASLPTKSRSSCTVSILDVLLDVYPTSLKSTQPHLCIQSKITKLWMSSKSAIFVHHEVLKVVPNWVEAWSRKISCSSWKESWKCKWHVTLCLELIYCSTIDLGPWQRLTTETVGLQRSLSHHVLLSFPCVCVTGTKLPGKKGSSLGSYYYHHMVHFLLWLSEVSILWQLC